MLGLGVLPDRTETLPKCMSVSQRNRSHLRHSPMVSTPMLWAIAPHLLVCGGAARNVRVGAI